MFQNLSDKLQGALRHLRGQAVISEANIAAAMDSIRDALFEADVNVSVAQLFVEDVRKACLGESVVRSVTPGQMAVKIVFDKLTALMGEKNVPLLSGQKPNIIMMVGLHGSGKTTTAAKLALNLKKQNHSVMLCAGDIYRPAAIDQLEVLANEIGVPVYTDRNSTDVAAIAQTALAKARETHTDYLIIDTAGRLQIDTDMIGELIRVSNTVRAQEILLVADAALGQQAVSVATHFHNALHLTGIVLTKLDGDARGGAALSIRKVTDCPIKFVGQGEKIEDLELFYPDRMASRILGMGDIVTLVEKAADKMDQEEAEKMEANFRKNNFDFNDFLSQLRQMSRIGGVESILKFLPGGAKLADLPQFDAQQFKYMEAIICSMNQKERENAEMIDMSRRRRIAKGCGRPVDEVSQLIKQFTMMKKVMKNTGVLNKLFGGGLNNIMSAFKANPLGPGGMGGGFQGGFRSPGVQVRGSNYTPPKKKRRK